MIYEEAGVRYLLHDFDLSLVNIVDYADCPFLVDKWEFDAVLASLRHHIIFYDLIVHPEAFLYHLTFVV